MSVNKNGFTPVNNLIDEVYNGIKERLEKKTSPKDFSYFFQNKNGELFRNNSPKEAQNFKRLTAEELVKKISESTLDFSSKEKVHFVSLNILKRKEDKYYDNSLIGKIRKFLSNFDFFNFKKFSSTIRIQNIITSLSTQIQAEKEKAENEKQIQAEKEKVESEKQAGNNQVTSEDFSKTTNQTPFFYDIVDKSHIIPLDTTLFYDAALELRDQTTNLAKSIPIPSVKTVLTTAVTLGALAGTYYLATSGFLPNVTDALSMYPSSRFVEQSTALISKGICGNEKFKEMSTALIPYREFTSFDALSMCPSLNFVEPSTALTVVKTINSNEFISPLKLVTVGIAVNVLGTIGIYGLNKISKKINLPSKEDVLNWIGDKVCILGNNIDVEIGDWNDSRKSFSEEKFYDCETDEEKVKREIIDLQENMDVRDQLHDDAIELTAQKISELEQQLEVLKDTTTKHSEYSAGINSLYSDISNAFKLQQRQIEKLEAQLTEARTNNSQDAVNLFFKEEILYLEKKNEFLNLVKKFELKKFKPTYLKNLVENSSLISRNKIDLTSDILRNYLQLDQWTDDENQIHYHILETGNGNILLEKNSPDDDWKPVLDRQKIYSLVPDLTIDDELLEKEGEIQRQFEIPEEDPINVNMRARRVLLRHNNAINRWSQNNLLDLLPVATPANENSNVNLAPRLSLPSMPSPSSLPIALPISTSAAPDSVEILHETFFHQPVPQDSYSMNQSAIFENPSIPHHPEFNYLLSVAPNKIFELNESGHAVSTSANQVFELNESGHPKTICYHDNSVIYFLDGDQWTPWFKATQEEN